MRKRMRSFLFRGKRQLMVFVQIFIVTSIFILPIFKSIIRTSVILTGLIKETDKPDLYHPTNGWNNKSNNARTNINGDRYVNHRPYTKIYGHLHFPKTGGSNLNGLMASKYERVCGNKGYSYDYYQHNQRISSSSDTKDNNNKNKNNQKSPTLYHKSGSANDVISKAGTFLKDGNDYDRGKIPREFQDEVGYEDCEYISIEMPWKIWPRIADTLQLKSKNMTLELHIPCRLDPIELLMSMANHIGIKTNRKKFDCSNLIVKSTMIINQKEIQKQADEVWMGADVRFNSKLIPSSHNKNIAADTSSNNVIDAKCFNPFPIERYVDGYMKDKLQPRRFPVEQFVYHDTNLNRDKDKECIWNQSNEIQTLLRQYLIKKHPYIQFCNKCMGSVNELQL